MTGNIRQGIGLLVVAALLGLIGLVLLGVPPLGGVLILSATLVAVIALVRIAADLLRPQRD